MDESDSQNPPLLQVLWFSRNGGYKLTGKLSSRPWAYDLHLVYYKYPTMHLTRLLRVMIEILESVSSICKHGIKVR